MDQRIISIAKRTLEIEAAALNGLQSHIDTAFVESIKLPTLITPDPLEVEVVVTAPTTHDTTATSTIVSI